MRNRGREFFSCFYMVKSMRIATVLAVLHALVREPPVVFARSGSSGERRASVLAGCVPYAIDSVLAGILYIAGYLVSGALGLV